MDMPTPIRTYFEADRKGDAGGIMSVVATDAVVEDEGRSYSGCAEIEAWWRGAKVKYKHEATPTATARDGDLVEVRATVTGSFPGSPADLTFAFRLRNGAVAGLRIGA